MDYLRILIDVAPKALLRIAAVCLVLVAVDFLGFRIIPPDWRNYVYMGALASTTLLLLETGIRLISGAANMTISGIQNAIEDQKKKALIEQEINSLEGHEVLPFLECMVANKREVTIDMQSSAVGSLHAKGIARVVSGAGPFQLRLRLTDPAWEVAKQARKKLIKKGCLDEAAKFVQEYQATQQALPWWK